MRKTVSLLTIICVATLAFSQINIGILPPSFQKNSAIEKSCQRVEITPPNMTKMEQEDETAAKNGTFLPIGKLLPVHLTAKNAGTWSVNSDGRSVWRLALASAGAKGCTVLFDRFWLPGGAELFVYNPDGSVILGPFTSADNPEELGYSIGMIYGNEAILEYVAPRAKVLDGVVKNVDPILEISEFGYIYRDVIDLRATKELGDSESCQVNVNCSEGDNWRTQQKGVARILVYEGNLTGWCSGTLINNTKNDQTPYFLTADHCGGANGKFASWQFYFNYETPGCANVQRENQLSKTTVLTGCKRVARQPLNGSSDFLLLQLYATTAKIAEFGGVFNGWSTATAGSKSGVSIHHPAGDVKKISTYKQQLTSGTYQDDEPTIGATNAHWVVRWAATANGHGTTEGGSSGSPLFNSEGLVVGTLSGGSSACDYTTGADLYGKFSKHWDAKTAQAEQLKHWLDPDNTGATTCEPLDINSKLTVAPDELKFGKVAETQSVSVRTSSSASNWTATTGANWISFTPSSGNGNNAVTAMQISVIANPGNDQRIGTITVTQGTETAIITVKQSGQISYGFSYDFEAATAFAVDDFAPCTTYDGDGYYSGSIQSVSFPNQGYRGSYIALVPSQTTPAISGVSAHSGIKCGACFFTQMGNDDWFITPKIQLGSQSKFKFAARSYVNSYGGEKFNVLISTTDNQPSSFTRLNASTITAPQAWEEYSFDISAYDNQKVYLAIQCVSVDQFIFLIDDIEVATEAPVSVNSTVVKDSKWNIFAKNGVLYVEADENSTLEIFNTVGQKIHSQQVVVGINAIDNLLNATMLIVRCGNSSKRIVVK